MFNPISLLTGTLSTATSFLGGAKVWLIILAVSVAASGAGGWYLGSTHESKIMANAAVQAADIARKSQSDKDSKDWAADKADYETRLTFANDAANALASLKDKRHTYVPNPTKATITADAMKALNDPALIGEVK